MGKKTSGGEETESTLDMDLHPKPSKNVPRSRKQTKKVPDYERLVERKKRMYVYEDSGRCCECPLAKEKCRHREDSRNMQETKEI